MRQRTQYGIGKGTLVARLATKGKGSIALLTRLPGGKSWLLSVCNFSRQPISENISLAAHPAVLKTSGKRALLRSGGGTCALSGANASVQLGAWEGVALVIGAGQTAADAPKKPAEQGEKITPIPDFSQPEASAPEAQAAAAPVKEAPVPTEKAAPAEEATPAEKPVAKSAETSAEKSAEEKAKLAEEAEKRRKRNDADDASSMLGARKKRPAEAPAKAAAEAQPEPEAQEITQPAASPENVRQISYSLPASALAPRKKAESAAPVLTTKRIAAAPAVIKKDAELMAAVASELGAPAKRKTAVSTAKAPAAEPLVTKAPAAEPPAVKPPAAPPAPSATKQAAQPALQQTPAQAGNPLQAGTTSGPDVFRYVYAASNSHSKSAAEAHAAKLTKEGFAARVATEGGTYRTVIDFIGKPMETRIPKAKLKALGIKDAWMVSKKPM